MDVEVVSAELTDVVGDVLAVVTTEAAAPAALPETLRGRVALLAEAGEVRPDAGAVLLVHPPPAG